MWQLDNYPPRPPLRTKASTLMTDHPMTHKHTVHDKRPATDCPECVDEALATIPGAHEPLDVEHLDEVLSLIGFDALRRLQRYGYQVARLRDEGEHPDD